MGNETKGQYGASARSQVAGGSRDCIVPNTRSDSWCAPLGSRKVGHLRFYRNSRKRNIGHPPRSKDRLLLSTDGSIERIRSSRERISWASWQSSLLYRNWR